MNQRLVSVSSTFCFQRQGAGGHLASYTTASLGHSLPPRLAYTQVGHLQMHAKKELEGQIFFYTKNEKPNLQWLPQGAAAAAQLAAAQQAAAAAAAPPPASR